MAVGMNFERFGYYRYVVKQIIKKKKKIDM